VANTIGNRERFRVQGFKWNLSVRYLTAPEVAEFKRLKQSGAITVFRLARCLNCGGDIPKVEDNGALVKEYCTKKCYDAKNPNDEDEDDADDESDEHDDPA
jgi:hypothetical protein